jgi:isoleucyl-tRNA synthetase
MPELERYVLHLLSGLDATLRQAIADYDFNEYTRALVDFCNEDLSAFFFDIRKDSLYCDAPADLTRRAYRTTLDILFQALIRYAAPVLVFTAEEVWTTRFPDRGSLHLQEIHPLPASWQDAALAERFKALRALRVQVSEAIEPMRREKIVGSSLAATVTVPADAPEGDLAELFITGTVTRGQGIEVTVAPTTDHKCGRCWRHLPEVTADGDLCGRCDGVVNG